MGITAQALEPTKEPEVTKPVLDEADIAVFNINRNREQRRRFYKANRKAYKGLTFSEVNSDPRVNKITPYVNEEKRANRRAYIKARRGVN